MPLDLSPKISEETPVINDPKTISLKNIIIGVLIGGIVIATLSFLASSFLYPNLIDLFLTKEVAETNTKAVTQSATPSTQKDETKSWKTYVGKTIAVSFEIPSDFSVTDRQGKIENTVYDGLIEVADGEEKRVFSIIKAATGLMVAYLREEEIVADSVQGKKIIILITRILQI